MPLIMLMIKKLQLESKKKYSSKKSFILFLFISQLFQEKLKRFFAGKNSGAQNFLGKGKVHHRGGRGGEAMR